MRWRWCARRGLPLFSFVHSASKKVFVVAAGDRSNSDLNSYIVNSTRTNFPGPMSPGPLVVNLGRTSESTAVAESSLQPELWFEIEGPAFESLRSETSAVRREMLTIMRENTVSNGSAQDNLDSFKNEIFSFPSKES